MFICLEDFVIILIFSIFGKRFRSFQNYDKLIINKDIFYFNYDISLYNFREFIKYLFKIIFFFLIIYYCRECFFQYDREIGSRFIVQKKLIIKLDKIYEVGIFSD